MYTYTPFFGHKKIAVKYDKIIEDSVENGTILVYK